MNVLTTGVSIYTDGEACFRDCRAVSVVEFIGCYWKNKKRVGREETPEFVVISGQRWNRVWIRMESNEEGPYLASGWKLETN